MKKKLMSLLFSIVFMILTWISSSTIALAACNPDNFPGGSCTRNGRPGTLECFGGRPVCVLDDIPPPPPKVCPFGADQCLQGFVWREAFPGDHVCVSGATRTQTANDNAQAAARRDPSCRP